ncbi:response regulator [Gellertiella hungarica]|uniref:Two-component system chemotaxis response regulator CheY n=1 Tax=Gellertiella hungarica TaxID=1572859 RepID=A0A7W6JA22_9HYPH|nr:response regulator [Gellertiella hungarica]MBB4066647.1 two-component system chemotaxis response regulator CheY [Gellertiella hungarica]
MKTILVVDDSTLMQWSLKTTLEGARFRVESCPDGTEAMKRINSGLKPDLILTDLNMPNMDGLALIKAVRAKLRFTPIIVVSTESQASRKDEAKRAGATGWLVKPVQPNDMLRVIGKVLPEMA